MTTTRRDRVIIFECDLCAEELDTGEVEFHDALQAKKDEGWGSRRDDDGWMDVCETCKRMPE